MRINLNSLVWSFIILVVSATSFADEGKKREEVTVESPPWEIHYDGEICGKADSFEVSGSEKHQRAIFKRTEWTGECRFTETLRSHSRGEKFPTEGSEGFDFDITSRERGERFKVYDAVPESCEGLEINGDSVLAMELTFSVDRITLEN